MKTAKTRLMLTLLAASLGMAALTACGDSTTEATPTGTQSADTAVTDAETEETIKSLVPDDIDLGGKNIRIMNTYYFENDAFMLEAESSTGDVVNDAVYNRNAAVSDKLNVTFSYDDYYIPQKAADSVIRKSVTAGSDDYDIIFGVQYHVVPQVLNNCFLDLSNAKYLNLDQPWWYQEYTKELSIGENKTYFATGDITLGVLRNMSCMYVNKDLYRQYYESVDEIYDNVLNGTWTMDKLSEQCAELYQDLNGDGKSDEEDRFGIGVICANLTDHFTYDAGIRATERDEDNIPYLTMNNEKTVNFTQKLYSLYYENPGVHIFASDYTALDVTMPTKFNANELLYLPGWFYTSELLRDMEVDYAVIPFPKYDESQETYLSLAHDISIIVCVPATCTELDSVSAVMEEMAFLGYRDVLPAYYEVAIKVKYSRDSTDKAMQILDIIHDNSTTDFAFIYNYALNGIGLIERDLMAGKKADFVSMYTKKEKTAEKKLAELVEVFTAIE